VWADLTRVARVLHRSPAFAVTVIVTLALAIGANAALFSLADTLYLKPIPVKAPERLVAIVRGGSQADSNTFSYPLYGDVRDSTASFDGVIAFAMITIVAGVGGEPEPVDGQLVSGNYFTVLGVRAALGRTLLPDDDRVPDGHPVAVISYDFWRTRLASRRDVVGSTAILNQRAYTIVGVAARGFTGTLLDSRTEVWVPMAMQMHMRPPSAGAALQQGLDLLTRRSAGWLFAAARLADGASVDRANAELRVIVARLEAEYPQLYQNYSLHVAPIADQSRIRGESRTTVVILFSIVGLVLVVACTNIAGLLLARTTERRREIGIRRAIGATGARLLWLVIGEYLFLSVIGGGLGLMISTGGMSLLRAWVVSPSVDLSVDRRVVVFTAVVVALSGLLTTQWPAITIARANLVDALADGRGATSHRVFVRRALVGVQIAISVVLVVIAGLAIRTVANVMRVDVGLDIDRVAIIPLDARSVGLTLAAAPQFYERARVLAAELPAVDSVALARIAPMSGGSRSGLAVRPGTDGVNDNSRLAASVNVVGPGFFQVLGVPILSGRDFERSDTASSARVAVVSAAAAQELWGERDPIGEELVVDASQRVRIVGVVADARYRSPRLLPGYSIFFPLAQQPELGVSMLIRTRADASLGLSAVLNRLRTAEPRLVLRGSATLREFFDTRTRDDRMFAAVVSGLAATAVALATLGIYAIVSFVVNQQRREVGVRIALGSTAASVVGMMMIRHAPLIAGAVAAGIAASTLGSRLVRARLFEVPSIDVTTYAATIVVMTIVATAATWIPARRVSRLDPANVLRTE
jgi:predicted permease